MRRLLEKIQFRNPERARQIVDRLSQSVSPEVQAGLRSLLVSSPNPDQALAMLARLEDEKREAFDRLTSSAAGMTFLLAVFSYSRFLSEAVLRHPEWLDQLVRAQDLDRVLTSAEYQKLLEQELEAETFLDPSIVVPPPHALALFRKKQLLRILIRDVLGYATLAELVEELSNLADAVLEVVLRRLTQDLEGHYGTPLTSSPEGDQRRATLTAVSLGKLGGRELNYSSDIDLMFLYSGEGQTSGPASLPNKVFFQKLTSRLVELLSAYSPEGRCYRVDLRLRPEGRLGDLAISLPAALQYYQSRARDWELQMLIKARISAGDPELGERFLESIEPLIYATSLNFSAIEAMSATRDRIDEKLAARKGWRSGFDIKLARGGIRDIEFLVQCLQRLHGGHDPWVRHGGTMLALARLRDKGYLTAFEYSRLMNAYQFFRYLEHRLQFDEDRQTHVLPSDPDELDVLARKMPPFEGQRLAGGEALLKQVSQYLEDVREIYEKVIHYHRIVYYAPVSSPPTADVAWVEQNRSGETIPPALLAALYRRAPTFAKLISEGTWKRAFRHLQYFVEHNLENNALMAGLEADRAYCRRLLDLFEHSQYFSDLILRHPELVPELQTITNSPLQLPPPPQDSMDALRRYFRLHLFRIQSQSICLCAPIFTTLEQMSDLADTVIRAAYKLALAQTSETHPPSSPAYQPSNQLLIIALGRLGMREFDLASDADLVFALPDTDAHELQFWTRVAERIIEIITAYTGEGVIFAVDTRLRPNGREGPLVQTESAFQEYFSRRAEAWEGITYMKSRCVAGSSRKGTRFLQQLQDVDWRRYGQSGRSKAELREMRLRLEREQGAANPLKAGRGGYYDIDFALLYLRLKGAGIFFKVLNTPARIDVVEKMGHLERPDADFLRDAATFYRAVDHGLRVSTGHAEGKLPTSPAMLENLTELVRRWTPRHLHDQPLEVELAQIQARTREFFNRLFQG